MVGVITAALAASTAGLLAAVVSHHSLAAALVAGGITFIAILWALMRFEGAAMTQVGEALLNIDADTANASRD